jgi:hypothetical protein
MATKSVAEKASIYMQIGQAICEMVDESGILVKPKRKPRVVKRKKVKKAEQKKVAKKPAPRREPEEDDDEGDE